ncbi:hypothetical protein BH10BAC3_BH10BAC3_15810 [soil metagenome]
MINYRKYNPVRCLSLPGKLLVKTLRSLYGIRKLTGLPKWETPIPSHHEDPLKMTFAEKLYLGYKYYYKGMVKAEPGAGLEDYFKNQTLQPAVPADFKVQETITLSAGGDLIPYACITPENCHQLWNEAGDFFFNNDIVFANLETVADLSKPYSAAPEVMLHDMFFNIHEESFQIFSGNGKYKGYDVLSTANNHTMDVGETGIVATQHFLQSKKIEFTGTASSKETRDDFPIIERKGIRIAFIAYTYSLNKETLPAGKEWLCNHLNLNEPNADISLIIHHATLARGRGADIIVASLHMGCAYQAYPSKFTVDNMHRICREAGVDILLGGHPHNMQPMEIFETNLTNEGLSRQHFIVYSLGDFIAYDIFKWCHLPMLLRLHISKGTINGKPHTIVSRIDAKPFYMYQNKNEELKLVDFIKASKNPSLYFAEKTILKEIEELSDFFNRFIINEKQQNILA